MNDPTHSHPCLKSLIMAGSRMKANMAIAVQHTKMIERQTPPTFTIVSVFTLSLFVDDELDDSLFQSALPCLSMCPKGAVYSLFIIHHK